MSGVLVDHDKTPVTDFTALAVSTREIWRAAYKRHQYGGAPPDLQVLGEQLKAGVRRSLALGGGALSAIAQVYHPSFLNGRRSAVAALELKPTATLLEIENRLSRALHIRQEPWQFRQSLLRQAALMDMMAPGERLRARDMIMECILSSGVTPDAQEGPQGWRELVTAHQTLATAPTGAEIDAMSATPPVEELDRVAELSSRLSRVLFASPPRAWKPHPTASQSMAHGAVLTGPRLASRLHDLLRSWAELTHPATPEHARFVACRRDLEDGLRDWLSRSTPSDATGARDLSDTFREWQRHLSRARLARAHTWDGPWFALQQWETVLAGSRLIRDPAASPEDVARYAELVTREGQRGAPPPQGLPDDWYQAEAAHAFALLTREQAERVFQRVEAAGEAYPWESKETLVFLLGGGAPADAHRACEALRIHLGQCATPIARWLIERTICRIEGASSPPPPELPAHLAPARIAKLIVDHTEMAQWLIGVQEMRKGLEGTEWDELIAMFDDAIAELFGRGDSAISVALAHRLVTMGHFENARALVARIALNDNRPRTVAICESLLGTITLRQNPGGTATWGVAYNHFLRSWRATAHFSLIPDEALGALLNAAAVAVQAGWPASAAWCTRKIRRSEKDGRPLDSQPWIAMRLRLQAFAVWAAGRKMTAKGRSLRQKALQLAISRLWQSTDLPDLVFDRALVAHLAQALPGNHELPDLIRDMPAPRLHGLAMALQRHGRRAIDDLVMVSALDRLDDTADSAAFIGAWLARRYFESDDFRDELTSAVQEILSRPFGAAAMERILAEAHRSIAGEMADRCAEQVLAVANLGHPRRQAEGLVLLLQGKLTRALKPAGYGGRGRLFVDATILRTLVDTPLIEIDAPRGFWVEALFGARALDGLARHLRLEADAADATGALARVANEHNGTISLRADQAGLPVLTYAAVIYAAHGVEPSAWRQAAAQWERSLRSSLAQLKSERVLPPTLTISLEADRLEVRLNLLFWLPKGNPAVSEASQLHELFDRHYGLHLARLSGRAPGEMSCPAIGTLHTARTELRGLCYPAPVSALRTRRMHSRAAIRSAARAISMMVGRPGNEEAELQEVLRPVAAEFGIDPIGGLVGNVRVALSPTLLRLTLRTVLQNALAAQDHTGAPAAISVESLTGEVVIQVDAPFVDDWREQFAGLGIGVRSVAVPLAFSGGFLSQGRDGEVWRTRIGLPLPQDWSVLDETEVYP
jgi:hypothetical protein